MLAVQVDDDSCVGTVWMLEDEELGLVKDRHCTWCNRSDF